MGAAKPRLAQVVLDTTDARRAAEFWRALLGLVYRPGDEQPPHDADDEAGRDWLCLRLSDGTPLLAFQQVTETLASYLAPPSGSATAALRPRGQ